MNLRLNLVLTVAVESREVLIRSAEAGFLLPMVALLGIVALYSGQPYRMPSDTRSGLARKTVGSVPAFLPAHG